MAPDYGRTAYSSQGLTLECAKVDLNFSKNIDPVTGYVAISRVKLADDILILQPFSLDVFQQGEAQQPHIMMEYMKLEKGKKHLIQPKIDAYNAELQAKKDAKAQAAQQRQRTAGEYQYVCLQS